MDSPLNRRTPVSEDEFDSSREKVQEIARTVSEVFVGKEQVVRQLLNAFICGLHVLIEDVPGVGKTTLARALAASVGLDFGRIQFTPDLLPGDILGVSVWSPESREFVFKQGAIMHQMILADEINRASPRTQSAMLEAMQENTVSVDGQTHHLPEPFFVVATQNPAEHAGVFPLPESELDRFGLSFSIGYPAREEEKRILSRFQEDDPLRHLTAVMEPEELSRLRRMVRKVYVSEAARELIVQIAEKTRAHERIRLGASPRATQHLQLAAQGWAILEGRDFVIPEDILALVQPVLAHRVLPSAQARVEGIGPFELIQEVTRSCRVPIGLR
jgi:MoxR-like ATPase